MCLFCCILYLVHVLIVVIMEGDLSLVRVLCVMLWNVAEMIVMSGEVTCCMLCATLWWVCRCLV